jgi:hypothetical protein
MGTKPLDKRCSWEWTINSVDFTVISLESSSEADPEGNIYGLYIAQGDFKLVKLLPQSPECWNYRPAPPRLFN